MDVKASRNMMAVQVLCKYGPINQILSPHMNIERDEISWEKINYHELPGGFQAALSWAYCVFCDLTPPMDWEYRDAFDSFSVMDRELQVLALEAMAIRHGFVSIKVEDKPKSDFVKMLESMGEDLSKKLDKDLKKKKIKLVE